MDGFRHTLGPQHLIDGFGGQGDEGSGSFGKDQQRIVQCLVGITLVAVGVALPEAAAAAADVPVGQIVDEAGEAVGCLLEIVVVKLSPQFCHHAGAGAQDPAVKDIGRVGGGLDLSGSRGVAVHIGVGGEERKSVPHGDHHLAEHLADTGF